MYKRVLANLFFVLDNVFNLNIYENSLFLLLRLLFAPHHLTRTIFQQPNTGLSKQQRCY